MYDMFSLHIQKQTDSTQRIVCIDKSPAPSFLSWIKSVSVRYNGCLTFLSTVSFISLLYNLWFIASHLTKATEKFYLFNKGIMTTCSGAGPVLGAKVMSNTEQSWNLCP